MTSNKVIGILAATLLYPSLSQAAEFEVAVIRQVGRPTIQDWGVMASRMKELESNPTRYEQHFVSMSVLLVKALGIQPGQLVSPAWTGDRYFTIEAVLPEGSTKAEIPAMLRSLLISRFGLAFHHENKELRAPALELAGGGIKAPLAKSEGEVTRSYSTKTSPKNGFVMRLEMSGSTASLAKELSRNVGMVVRDKTNITGLYHFDFTAELAGPSQPVDETASEYAIENIGEALRPLGLRLEYKMLPVDTVVVDQLSKTPNSPN